jgi:2-hydroxy-3-oxopropionate reductase
LDTGRQIGAPLFLTAQVMEMLKCLKLEGKGQKDHSAILNYYEKLAGVEVRKKT